MHEAYERGAAQTSPLRIAKHLCVVNASVPHVAFSITNLMVCYLQFLYSLGAYKLMIQQELYRKPL